MSHNFTMSDTVTFAEEKQELLNRFAVEMAKLDAAFARMPLPARAGYRAVRALVRVHARREARRELRRQFREIRRVTAQLRRHATHGAGDR